MFSFNRLPDESGGSRREGVGLFGREVMHAAASGELTVELVVALQVVMQAGGDVFALGNNTHVRGRVGAYLI